MSSDSWVRLESLGVILADGPDAFGFLQGQLTADLDGLRTDRMLLAACNSPQGRVQAVVRLIRRADAIAMILPSAMLDTTLTRLRKYVLRAKARLHSGTERLAAYALARTAAPAGVQLAPSLDHVEHAGVSYVNWLPASNLLLALAPPGTSARAAPDVEAALHLEEISAGLPQVYAQTHESFVAQMLNLDLLGGISFEKGCYTGQEIIARTHFRGAIKRRMFRFAAASAPPAPGARLVHGDQHAGEVVDAAASGAGSELLAVVNLAQKDAELRLEGTSTPLQRLPMSYEVPA
jgi:folate-binding protein YgfZ